MDALAAVAASDPDCLRGVDADANGRREAMVTPVLGERLLDRDGTRESGARRRERDEEAVARMIDLLATVPEKSARSVRSCHSTRSSQAVSPMASTRAVDPTMSVKRNVS